MHRIASISPHDRDVSLREEKILDVMDRNEEKMRPGTGGMWFSWGVG